MRMNRLAVTAVAVVAGLSLSACGGDDDATDTAAPSSPSATSAGTPTQSSSPEEGD
ncbi:DUF4232 domain-containing protein, partial [Streptomyces sp. SID724]|nr:DUF4232 domain-containing protein [Streptomyces sp. SID724]